MSAGYPSTSTKPSKPYPEFPLIPHANRRWAKKIRGKMHYFGPWADPDTALKEYQDQRHDLHAGRTPRQDPEALTVKDLANAFLTHKRGLLDAGELSPRTWADYKTATDLLVGALGKQSIVADVRPDDFAELRARMSSRWGPVRVRDFIQRIRSVFKFALEAELIDRPVRFGQGLVLPT